MEGGVGPVLKFKNLYMKHGKDYAIEYRVRVNVGSDRGTGVNSAYGQMGRGTKVRTSQVVKSKVKVRLGVFTKEGCVFGKVYMDCSANNPVENELRNRIGWIKGEYRDWETDRKSTRLNSSHRL